ncbi:hypothetical protein E2P81_ATG03832 [Venturia nashicola]|uniref:Uncharacterized protein n=1 Tax=Venturia nashicola TaxID=86259 RepID=A0A4Z1PJV2_9PEZI|nr:hypothetical protein E6O75_ATG03924 [Venturia nashicola]TLD38157.1 hypothetical protein E2P81_ATG03832 [Venturia nashicola]
MALVQPHALHNLTHSITSILHPPPDSIHLQTPSTSRLHPPPDSIHLQTPSTYRLHPRAPSELPYPPWPASPITAIALRRTSPDFLHAAKQSQPATVVTDILHEERTRHCFHPVATAQTCQLPDNLPRHHTPDTDDHGATSSRSPVKELLTE